MSTAAYQDASRGGLSKAVAGASSIGFKLGRCTGLGSSGAGPLVRGGRSPLASIYSYLHWLHPLSATGNYWTERRRAAPSCGAGAARVRFRVLMVNDPAGEDHWLAWEVCSLACDFGVPGSCHGQDLLGMFAGLESGRLAQEREPLPHRHWHSRQRTTRGGVRRGCSLACD